MFKKTLFLNKFSPMYEDFFFNYNLNLCTKFNIDSTTFIPKCNKIVLNFGFKDIKFEKKQMILYFFLLELLSNQKCSLTSSRKNLINLKIKRGSITGCKVTLRNKNLYNFFNLLLLGLPRSEVFKGFTFIKNNSNFLNNYSTKLKNLFIFYPLETLAVTNVKYLDITFIFNTINEYDKCFFFTHHKLPLNFV